MSGMENLSLLESLNPPQKEAVTSPFDHVLVLAGAGSGKTRVLTHRIAWLIQQKNVSPYSILAVTFTNKAAYEMRGRIESMLGMPMGAMWVGTFHGLAHRLLRAHWKDAGLPQSFQILDTDDQYRLIRRMQRNLNLEESQWPPKQTQWFINKQKEEGRRSHQVLDSDGSYFTETLVKVYKAYEDVCRQSGLVDFAELLLRTLELLRDSATLREHYQQRFQHILVDEFQDTNTIQYAWLKALAGEQTVFMAVGDDDQSIYSWRGAKIENIHHFSRDFAGVKTIRLEQNYRSTQTILDAANAVIDNNKNRFGKKLWTDSRTGEPITLYTAFNERDEAFYVISCIDAWVRQGHSYNDVAILYRSNAQSRLFEECLIDRQIPYRIYGGLKFFERAEIKDALAYLRLMANRNDDAAFERVVNVPTRGIGNTTLVALRTTARDHAVSLWQATQHLITNQTLNARALNALQHFIELVDRLQDETKNLPLAEQTEKMLMGSGLLDLYKKDNSEKGLSRVENLEELINATSQFTPTDDLALSPLDAFLSHVALETGEEQASAHSDCVSLMTLHAAKGLEFPLVIISGLEEDLFPHRMSIDAANGLEEERRLCYVGMTRAREKLILTYTESRRLHGLEKFNQPSRFIQEIPPELIDAVRPTPKIARPVTITSTQKSLVGETGYYVGQRVSHKKFGPGIIINYEGHSEHARLQVKFDYHGTKWLVASYAKLEALT
ncbi:DNA helicase II [Coxiella burnetii]|uniref:DNA helicase II n=1 Tax=Coxiella burnetii TaxID=777 RepID=UPI000B955A60|nr:DNA helicase II [Coxiella burnetii]OYK79291.1 DNA helicase II [Coxiella burnetii]